MSNPLPAWVERLLGIQTEPGEGMAWSLEHTWNWPAWVTLLFAIAAVLFVVTIYLRENRQARGWHRMLLAGIRLGLVGIVLVMLAQFALSLHKTGLPYMVVLVDDSLSMTIDDPYDTAAKSQIQKRFAEVKLDTLSRWNLARTLLLENDAALLRKIAKDYKLRVYFVTGGRPSQSSEVGKLADELRAMEPRGENSRIGEAVRDVLNDLRGSAPAAIVLLSDGINTDGPSLAEAAAMARRKGVPLFLVGLGDDKPIRDLKLTDMLVDEIVFINDVVYFEAKLGGSGYAGKEVTVTLRRKDKPDVLAQTKVTLPDDGQSQTVRLPYRPTEEGEFRYVVEVEPQEGELETDNNRQERTVRVRKEQIRVLLVQSAPSFEYRYLRNLLARDNTIQLHTVLQEADVDHAEQDAAELPGFPVRREDVFRYDVIILGDVNPASLTQDMLQNLADFVDQPGKGGAMVLIAGPRFMPLAFRDTPLARLMPIELGTTRLPPSGEPLTEGFVMQPTDLGLASPPFQLGDTPEETREMWQKLAPLYWMLEAPDLKPAARVLAEHPNRLGHAGQRLPLVVLQYAGAGKVLFHATDETWRWRFRVGDVLFARYWIQTIRYLARSKLTDGDRSATLSADRREYRRGEPVQLRVRFADQRKSPAADDGVTVVLEQQGHQTQRVQLQRSAISRGVFETQLPNLAIGDYHAWVAAPTLEGQAPAADFSVVAPPGEFERVARDTAELKRAAELTKGRFYTALDSNKLASELPRGRQVPIESLPPKPLWNRWPLLLAFLVLLAAEWLMRKLGGMV
jgi:hypothetical protein